MREFTDSGNVEWRVWDVTPAHLHPVTRGEDYLGNLQDGWLAFQSEYENRRLEAPYPANWETFSLAQLEELCHLATPVTKRKPTSPSGERRAMTAIQAEHDRETESNMDSRRTFMSPGGREWIVRIHECLDFGGSDQKVLRFTAGDIVVELKKWPGNWRDASTLEYAMMMLDAEPPRRRGKGEGPQRRQEDRPELK